MTIKVNNQDIEWEDMPEGFYLTDVKQHILWRDDETGAHFALVKFPVGGAHELPHPSKGESLDVRVIRGVS